jgi:hypothetical protein
VIPSLQPRSSVSVPPSTNSPELTRLTGTAGKSLATPSILTTATSATIASLVQDVL